MAHAAVHTIDDDDALFASRRKPRLIVVSPHLDDAVFGCGNLLIACPGSVVCTVFAGAPAEPVRTPWDEAAGFADSGEAMRVRRQEDERALALCGARPVWLDFLDAQYGATPTVEAVADALATQFSRFYGCVPVCPLGLWHSDHVLVGAAWRLLVRTRRLPSCIAYEDAIYRAMPGVLHGGFERLDAERLRASPLKPRFAAAQSRGRVGALKRRAIDAYKSQLRALEPLSPDVHRAEHYWRVAPGANRPRGTPAARTGHRAHANHSAHTPHSTHGAHSTASTQGQQTPSTHSAHASRTNRSPSPDRGGHGSLAP